MCAAMQSWYYSTRGEAWCMLKCLIYSSPKQKANFPKGLNTRSRSKQLKVELFCTRLGKACSSVMHAQVPQFAKIAITWVCWNLYSSFKWTSIMHPSSIIHTLLRFHLSIIFHLYFINSRILITLYSNISLIFQKFKCLSSWISSTILGFQKTPKKCNYLKISFFNFQFNLCFLFFNSENLLTLDHIFIIHFQKISKLIDQGKPKVSYHSSNLA